MMSHAMICAFLATDLPPTARHVATVLGHHHSHTDGRCFPSIATICRETGLCDKSVRLSIQTIAKAGHLTVVKGWKNNSYNLHPSPVSLTASPVSLTASPVSLTASPVSLTGDNEGLSPVSLTASPVSLTASPVSLTASPVRDTAKPEVTRIEPEFNLNGDAGKPSAKKPTGKTTLPEWLEYAASLMPPFPEFEAERGWNYYESKGWLVGRVPAKDWKACCRTWHGYWRKDSASPVNGRSNGSNRHKGAAKLDW